MPNLSFGPLKGKTILFSNINPFGLCENCMVSMTTHSTIVLKTHYFFYDFSIISDDFSSTEEYAVLINHISDLWVKALC